MIGWQYLREANSLCEIDAHRPKINPFLMNFFVWLLFFFCGNDDFWYFFVIFLFWVGFWWQRLVAAWESGERNERLWPRKKNTKFRPLTKAKINRQQPREQQQQIDEGMTRREWSLCILLTQNIFKKNRIPNRCYAL